MHDRIDKGVELPRRRSVDPWASIVEELRAARDKGDTRDQWPRRSVAIAVLVLVLAGAGIGGYLIGNSPEVDLDAVRSAAAAEGREAGLASGTDEGYSAAFREARNRTYAAAYSAAYRQAYAEEFRSRGLDPPERIPVRRRR
jgi:hypothetical protein